jgi:proline iminopeptidase
MRACSPIPTRWYGSVLRASGALGRTPPYRWRPAISPTHALKTLPFRFLFARLVTHYRRNHAFLEDNQLIRNIGLLDGIPGVLIDGRYDVSGPLETAWRLHRGWRTSELHVIADMGHGGGDTFVDTMTTSLSRVAGW